MRYRVEYLIDYDFTFIWLPCFLLTVELSRFWYWPLIAESPVKSMFCALLEADSFLVNIWQP